MTVLFYTAKAQVAYPVKYQKVDSLYCTDSIGVYNSANNIRLAKTLGEQLKIMTDLDKHNVKEILILQNHIETLNQESKTKNRIIFGLSAIVILSLTANIFSQ